MCVCVCVCVAGVKLIYYLVVCLICLLSLSLSLSLLWTQDKKPKKPRVPPLLSSKSGTATSNTDAPPCQDMNGEESKVDIPDPNSPSGFKKGYEADQILGATEMNKQILFLIKW